MSDPVTNVEIEDVLSSIRRLVTEETRGGLRKMVPEPEPEPERLVLTPALRVASTDVEPPEIVPEVAEDDPWKTPGARLFDAARDLPEEELPWYKKGLEQEQAASVAANLSEGEIADDIDFVDIPDSSQVPLDLGLHAIADTATQVQEALASDVLHLADPQMVTDDAEFEEDEFEEDEFAEDEFAEDGTQDLSDELAPDDVIPELEESQALEDLATDPALEEDAAEEPTDEARAEPANSTLEPVDEVTTETLSEPVEAEADVADYDHRAATLNAKIEALEAAIAETQDHWDPDGESEDDYAGTPVETMAWQDHDAQNEVAVDEVDAADDPSETEGLSVDEAILDEESLRELISDIVREELQGALGERITRNVRKLVRREIHRALTTQDLE
ncbi:MAG: hypothetical protein AB8B51_09390 [Sedimentitalea sp.]